MFRCLWTNSLTWDEQLWRGTLGSDLLSVQGTGVWSATGYILSASGDASPSGLQQSLAWWLWASYHLSKRQFLHLENDLTSQDGAWTWISYCTEALGTVPGSTIKSSWTEGPGEMLNFFSSSLCFRRCWMQHHPAYTSFTGNVCKPNNECQWPGEVQGQETELVRFEVFQKEP